MARPAAVALLFAAALRAAGAGGAADSEVRRKVAELQELLQNGEARLQSMELPQKQRRLFPPTTSLPPSILRATPGMTRHYTNEENHAGALDHMWLVLCGALVMLMQAGFTMVEVGSCRVKSVQAVLYKNLMDVAISTLGWWLFGWSFAYSGPHKGDGFREGFAGFYQFGGHGFVTAQSDGQQEPTTAIAMWYYRWAFCCAAVAIANSGYAERVRFLGYGIYSLVMSSAIFPVVVAWTWGNGWLAEMNKPGYFDFAGSGIVHLTGGIGALMAAIIAGPRQGRFEKAGVFELPDDYLPHSPPLTVLGTLILWFGWYGFTCGSTLSMSSVEKGFLAAQIAMNTTISASAGGLTVITLRRLLARRCDLFSICQGIIAGLVSVSASCSSIECGTALGIGVAGGVIFQLVSLLMKKLRIDDTVDAFAVYGACGMWGLFCAAVMDWGYGFYAVHGFNGFKCVGWVQTSLGCPDDGTPKMGGNLAAANFAEMFSIIAWSGGISAFVLFFLKRFKFISNEEGPPKPGEVPEEDESEEDWPLNSI